MFMERKEIKNPSVGRSLLRYKRPDETKRERKETLPNHFGNVKPFSWPLL